MTHFTKRQRQIIQTAIELIADKGIQQLTIKNLSQKIGIAESAIYRHFASKMDILLGILALFADNEQQMNRSLDDNTTGIAEKLQRLLMERFAYFAKNRAVASVIFSEELFRNDPRLSERIYELMQKNQEMIVRLIVQGQQSQEFRPDIRPESVAFMIMGGMRLIVAQWRFSGYDFDLQEKGRLFWQTVEILLKKK